MKNFSSISVLLLSILIVAFLAGCGGSSGGGGTSSGVLTLAVTDSPVEDASNVIVEFTGVEIQSSSGDRTRFDFISPRQIDLLALNGGGSEIILDQVTLPSGNYDWIRLLVNAECDTLDSYIDISGVQHPLWIPSGSQTGLKLVSGFTIPAGGLASFTIDFDLRKSVHLPQGQGNCSGNYKLKPALRMVNNIISGSIEGTVDPNLFIDQSCTSGNAVYAFMGANVIPDDIDGILPEPEATANVAAVNNIYQYKVAFLTPGEYTIAFTCQSQDDLAEQDNNIVFLGTTTVVVNPGESTIHNF